MSKKPKVRTLEISRSDEVVKLEDKINAAIRKKKLTGGSIRLFQHDDGTYGFSAQFSAEPGTKKNLDALYDLVMRLLPVTKRGRRRSSVRKVQAKFMIPAELHRKIKQKAKDEDISASELVARCLSDAV